MQTLAQFDGGLLSRSKSRCAAAIERLCHAFETYCSILQFINKYMNVFFFNVAAQIDGDIFIFVSTKLFRLINFDVAAKRAHSVFVLVSSVPPEFGLLSAQATRIRLAIDFSSVVSYRFGFSFLWLTKTKTTNRQLNMY